MDTNNNQTDIFGNVTTFVKEEPEVVQTPMEPQPMPEIPSFEGVESVEPQPSFQQAMEIPTVPVEPVMPQQPVAPVPQVEMPPSYEETVEAPTESFTEMSFVGVNQQPEGKTVSDSLITDTTSIIEEDKNSNMEPVAQNEDENAGLKFLAVLGIIFAITIILLPVLS